MIKINWVSILIIAAFLVPLLSGALSNMSEYKIRRSLWSIFDNVEIILCMLLSIFITRKVFFENDEGIFKNIYDAIPEAYKLLVNGNNIITYMLTIPIILLFILFIIRLITAPLINSFISPLADLIYSSLNRKSYYVKRILGAAWQIPKAIFFTLIVSLLINFTGYFYENDIFSKWISSSGIYNYVNDIALQPVLNSNITKKIPVLFKNSFRSPDIQQITELAKGNVRVIEYFNGVTLDEAIKSTPEIDAAAEAIVGNEANSRKKAFLIYNWICRNIEYDNDKAQKISNDSRGVLSGSIVAFNTRQGICFDYSSLYISMCRAVGLKVRLITGLGYSGVSWGDHAWNQVYFNEENRWINVDTTFGTVANYFDTANFSTDHKYDEIQGEW